MSATVRFSPARFQAYLLLAFFSFSITPFPIRVCINRKYGALTDYCNFSDPHPSRLFKYKTQSSPLGGSRKYSSLTGVLPVTVVDAPVHGLKRPTLKSVSVSELVFTVIFSFIPPSYTTYCFPGSASSQYVTAGGDNLFGCLSSFPRGILHEMRLSSGFSFQYSILSKKFLINQVCFSQSRFFSASASNGPGSRSLIVFLTKFPSAILRLSRCNFRLSC